MHTRRWGGKIKKKKEKEEDNSLISLSSNRFHKNYETFK